VCVTQVKLVNRYQADLVLGCLVVLKCQNPPRERARILEFLDDVPLPRSIIGDHRKQIVVCPPVAYVTSNNSSPSFPLSLLPWPVCVITGGKGGEKCNTETGQGVGGLTSFTSGGGLMPPPRGCSFWVFYVSCDVKKSIEKIDDDDDNDVVVGDIDLVDFVLLMTG
jgi:hypothetical protein